MKKLSLKNLSLKKNHILLREELKLVFGGEYIGGGGCDTDACCGSNRYCVFDATGLPPGICV